MFQLLLFKHQVLVLSQLVLNLDLVFPPSPLCSRSIFSLSEIKDKQVTGVMIFLSYMLDAHLSHFCVIINMFPSDCFRNMRFYLYFSFHLNMRWSSSLHALSSFLHICFTQDSSNTTWFLRRTLARRRDKLLGEFSIVQNKLGTNELRS